jgi:hypothetical protein
MWKFNNYAYGAVEGNRQAAFLNDNGVKFQKKLASLDW